VIFLLRREPVDPVVDGGCYFNPKPFEQPWKAILAYKQCTLAKVQLVLFNQHAKRLWLSAYIHAFTIGGYVGTSFPDASLHYRSRTSSSAGAIISSSSPSDRPQLLILNNHLLLFIKQTRRKKPTLANIVIPHSPPRC